MDELATMDATGLADLVKRGEVRPIELVERAIRQIERLNPALNAVVAPLYDQALEEARAFSRVRQGASGRGSGSGTGEGAPPSPGPNAEAPFAGIPTLVKDLADVAGARSARGSRFLKDYVAKVDSEIVARLRRAGFIVLGKSSTAEFGLVPTTEPEAFGPTRNPWDLSRSPGGSSGGAAAAVSSRIVPLAHANDGGGSIRIPASCCGLFGFKPSRGRTPGGGPFGLTAEHVITLSVRDSAAVLDAIGGPEPGSPAWAPPSPTRFRDVVERAAFDAGARTGPHRGAATSAAHAPTGKVVPSAPLRIAFSDRTLDGVRLHPDCVEAVQGAAKLCEKLGHHVEEAAPAIDGRAAREAFMALWTAGCAATVLAWSERLGKEPTPDQFEPLTWALFDIGRRQRSVELLAAQEQLQRISLQVAYFFQQYDVWLTPTLAEPPVPLGWFSANPEQPLAVLERTNAFVPFCPMMNVTGQPAVSVPLHWNAEGLPVGCHFTGRFGEDALLFALAAQLEQARPWRDRRPPIGEFS